MTPEESNPALIARPSSGIIFWVLYDHPKDFPQGWVLRPQFVMNLAENENEKFGIVTGGTGNMVTVASRLAWYASTPDQLEAILPTALTRIGPFPGDDEKIAKVWME